MRWMIRKARRKEWERWFAWRPVKLAGQWVWLEYVERQPCVDFMGGFDPLMDGYRYRDVVKGGTA